MAYTPATAALREIADMGLAAAARSTGAAISAGSRIFGYCSSHSSTQIIAAGFFAGCGRGYLGLSSLAHSTNNVGVEIGDLIVNIESSAGTLPGKVSWHAAITSTFNQASTSASSAFTPSAGFDVSVSSATT